MKTEVYSWRISAELKADIEREARARKIPVSTVLDAAVRDWLKKNDIEATAEDAQRRLHAAAARSIGVLAGGNPRGAETARVTIRERLRRRHGA